jgi:hypothetical protein
MADVIRWVTVRGQRIPIAPHHPDAAKARPGALRSDEAASFGTVGAEPMAYDVADDISPPKQGAPADVQPEKKQPLLPAVRVQIIGVREDWQAEAGNAAIRGIALMPVACWKGATIVAKCDKLTYGVALGQYEADADEIRLYPLRSDSLQHTESVAQHEAAHRLVEMSIRAACVDDEFAARTGWVPVEGGLLAVPAFKDLVARLEAKGWKNPHAANAETTWGRPAGLNEWFAMLIQAAALGGDGRALAVAGIVPPENFSADDARNAIAAAADLLHDAAGIIEPMVDDLAGPLEVGEERVTVQGPTETVLSGG